MKSKCGKECKGQYASNATNLKKTSKNPEQYKELEKLKKESQHK